MTDGETKHHGNRDYWHSCGGSPAWAKFEVSATFEEVPASPLAEPRGDTRKWGRVYNQRRLGKPYFMCFGALL